jgi:hypothetical protein
MKYLKYVMLALLRRADAVMLMPPAAAGCWTFV